VCESKDGECKMCVKMLVSRPLRRGREYVSKGEGDGEGSICSRKQKETDSTTDREPESDMQSEQGAACMTGFSHSGEQVVQGKKH
jgi:hypothetical protein